MSTRLHRSPLAAHIAMAFALTLVLGYCGLRFGEAVALRRKHVGDRVLTVRSSATAVTGRYFQDLWMGLFRRPPFRLIRPARRA